MKLIPEAMAQTEQAPSQAPEAAPAPTAPATPPAAPTPPAGKATTSTPAPLAPTDQPPTMPDLFAQVVPLLVIVAIVYAIVIRPQHRRQKEQQNALKNVRRGDTVVTSGGLIGKVTKVVDDAEFEIELAPNVRSRMLRTAISEIRTKGEPVKDSAPSKG
jgi:preprotein translocase subunit YajC